MNIKTFLLKLFYRTGYECNRFAQKTAYHIRKGMGFDVLETCRKKLFRKDTFERSFQNIISPTLLSDSIDTFLRDKHGDGILINKVKNAADNCLRGNWFILFQYRNINMGENGFHVDWYTDFATKYQYKNSHSYDCVKQNKKEGVDIKNVWELSRLQYIIAPAIMWRATGNPEYAGFVNSVIQDWIKSNQYGEGPNWNCSMEIGIRACNIAFALELIADCKKIDTMDLQNIIASLYLHMTYIRKNYENYCRITYNHYLGDLIGVLAVSALLRKLPECKHILRSTINSFEREIKRQILNDGGSFEGSTCYQGLVGEMFSLAALISRNCGIEMSETYKAQLRKAACFSHSLSYMGRMPQVGDNDSGRVICIVPHNALDYSSFHHMAETVLSANSNCWFDDRYCVCTGEEDEEQLSFLNDTKPSETILEIFPESGIVHLKNNVWNAVLYAVESQKYGMGGHTHNDKGGLILGCNGKEFFVDPGSGCYTPNPDISKKLRSVTSHSTISVNCKEQNLQQASIVFGNSYEAHCNTSIEGSAGIVKTTVNHTELQYVHTRKIEFWDSSELRLCDNVIAHTGNRIVLRFVMHPDVEYTLLGTEALLKNNGAVIKILTQSDFYAEQGIYSPSYGVWEKTTVLCAEYALSKEQISIIASITCMA